MKATRIMSCGTLLGTGIRVSNLHLAHDSQRTIHEVVGIRTNGRTIAQPTRTRARWLLPWAVGRGVRRAQGRSAASYADQRSHLRRAPSLPTTGRRRGDVGLLPARRAHRLPAATQPDRLAPGRHRLRHGRWGLRGRVRLLHGRDRSRLAPRRNPAGLARGCLTTDLAVLRAGPAAPAALPRRQAPITTLAPVAWATAATITVSTVSSALYPRDLAGDPRMPENPTGIHGWADRLDAVTSLSQLLLLALLLASLVAVGVRFRRARGVERQQLKWFAYGATALVSTSIAFLPLTSSGLFAPILVGFGLFTACITVAMLRYHLYDIDRLINRTLTYGLLTIVLGAIYAGAVVRLGQALHPWVGHSALAVAASTLLVAALFQRYGDTSRTGSTGASIGAATTPPRPSRRSAPGLREQLDLDTLSAELLGVVDQTMQPTRVSLWLRPPTRASQDYGDSVAHRAALRPTGASRSGHRGL